MNVVNSWGAHKVLQENKAENVLWDAVEEANFPQCKSIEDFSPKKFNKDFGGGLLGGCKEDGR